MIISILNSHPTRDQEEDVSMKESFFGERERRSLWKWNTFPLHRPRLHHLVFCHSLIMNSLLLLSAPGLKGGQEVWLTECRRPLGAAGLALGRGGDSNCRILWWWIGWVHGSQQRESPIVDPYFNWRLFSPSWGLKYPCWLFKPVGNSHPAGSMDGIERVKKVQIVIKSSKKLFPIP